MSTWQGSPLIIGGRAYCPTHGCRIALASICDGCMRDDPPVNPGRRLNIGCGDWPLLFFTNLDANPACRADLHATVPPIPFADVALDEIYAGHVLEHLTPDDARLFLAECFRCLSPGGRLGIVVPDTREIMARYLAGAPDEVEFPEGTWSRAADLDAVCRLFLYSTAQDSHHLWSYDAVTLRRVIESAGFVVTSEIDRYHDPRVTTGQWFQMGYDAIKPEKM